MFGTIAVDAISLDSTWVSNRAEKASDPPAEAFLYELLPFTTDAKCFPVHVMAVHSGNATEENCCRANEIAGIPAGMEPPFQVLFIATDGDHGYNGKYREQFASWIDHYDGSHAETCLHFIEASLPWYMAVFLHLVKNVRSRLITYIPAIRYKETDIRVDVEKIEKLLPMGPILSDKSSTGKMRDVYPIGLFRLEHVISLLKAGCVGEALYLFIALGVDYESVTLCHHFR
jgi:hypothetical protein